VETVHGAREAMEKMAGEVFDVVITDVARMEPGVDGMDLYCDALERHPYLKEKFLFTTDARSPESEEFLSRINARYLMKPFKVSELLEAVGAMTASPGGPIP